MRGIGGTKRARGMVECTGKKLTAPTMRLITIQNSVECPEQFGVSPLTTPVAMATPLSHAKYELIELPEYSEQQTRGMPWEEDDDTFRRFRASLPEDLTPDSFYASVALPTYKTVEGEQRSSEWHAARTFAVTASQFASASNENPGMSAAKLLACKTFPKRDGFRGNPYTQWGVIHEAHAEEAFCSFLSKYLGEAVKETEDSSVPERWHFKNGGTLEHPGFLRHPDSPYLGFSPDALLWNGDRTEVALVEYKCPAYQRSGPGHPYAAKNDLCIPRQYMPQIQGSLHLLRLLYPGKCVRAWFVVWQAHQFFVSCVPYVPSYASRIVHASTAFFHNRFIPACVQAISERDERAALGLPELKPPVS
jgi:hypothetical protein